MKGHIRQRGKAGVWYAVIPVADPTTGKLKKKWHRLEAKGKREAQIEVAELVSSIDKGTYLEPTKVTVVEFLTKWLKHIKSTVSPRTFERYGEIVTKYLAPALGDVRLRKLQAIAISAAYEKIRTSRTKGTGDLSNRTILHCHRVLSGALRQGVRWRLIPHNPASDVKPPRVERRKIRTHSLTETADMVEQLRGHWMHVPAVLGLLCGIRRGEIAALRWSAVDLDKGQIAIIQNASRTKAGVHYKDTKTGQARTLALSPAVVAELRQHRLRRAEAHLKLGRP